MSPTRRSLPLLAFAVFLFLGGLAVAVKGRLGQRADYAAGLHVRAGGAALAILGAWFGIQVIRRKPEPNQSPSQRGQPSVGDRSSRT